MNRDERIARLEAERDATRAILRAISRADGDANLALQSIAEAAGELCGGLEASLHIATPTHLRLAAMWGGAEAARRWAALATELPQTHIGYETPLQRPTIHNRAVESGGTVLVPDLARVSAEEMPHPALRAMGARTVAAVPLRRGDAVVGVISVSSTTPDAIDHDHVLMLETFADQAVIAIENSRLFQELQERLEQQTATGEVLQAISRSAFDLQAVLDTLVENATRLTSADIGIFLRPDPDGMRIWAEHGATQEFVALVDAHPVRYDRATTSGRAATSRQVVRIDDVLADAEYGRRDGQQAEGYRSVLAVPLLRGDDLLGVITVWKRRVEPFTDRHLELIRTFADQAVIAIENTRLFAELQRRLDEQTATGEILRAISSAPGDLQSVLDMVLESSMRLCTADVGAIFRREGDAYPLVAHKGLTREQIELFDREPIVPGRGSTTGRALLERRPVQISDIHSDPDYAHSWRDETPTRTMLSIPLLRDGEPIGAFTTFRADVRPFSRAEVALLQSFADQAVIAIENTRLFAALRDRTAELGRSVEQLTALGEVGRTVSSTLDLRSVLDTVVARAAELSGSDGGAVYEYDSASDQFNVRATRGVGDALLAAMRASPLRLGEGASGRAAALRRPVAIPDVAAPGAYASPLSDEIIRSGFRAVLAVPLLREEQVVGSLVLIRRRLGDFSPDVVELLSTFASQSALAIQNARLFQELADKSRQLEEASRHKSEFLANMSHELRTPLNAIIGFTEVLLERYFGELNEKQEEYLKDVLSSGQHLLSLINDILDLSKVEAGRMELELGTFDLEHVLQSGLVMVKERASKKGIDLMLELPRSPGRVEADERKVKQVLFNLLTNAVKFTPSGGKITVSARRADGYVEVAVTDTGVGIAPEEQGRVFEEFGQARNQAGQSEGTGLGLALCRRFVELHGGAIRLESAVGRGSTFAFTLPVKQEVMA